MLTHARWRAEAQLFAGCATCTEIAVAVWRKHSCLPRPHSCGRQPSVDTIVDAARKVRAPQLPRNSRKTECGAKQFLIPLVARAAPFALSCRAPISDDPD